MRAALWHQRQGQKPNEAAEFSSLHYWGLGLVGRVGDVCGHGRGLGMWLLGFNPLRLLQ